MTYTFQTNVITQHWSNPRVDPTQETDYLCLSSGHNGLSAKLVDYIKTRYDYQVDVVSLLFVTLTE